MEEKEVVEAVEAEVVSASPAEDTPKKVQKTKTIGTDVVFDILGMVALVIFLVIIAPLRQTLIDPLIAGETDLITRIVITVCVVLSLIIIFTEGHNVDGKQYEEQLIQIFPAIGMWGTFIGVAGALVGFNINGGDDSLNTLIKGLQTAVYTTVWGMTFFLWWSGISILKEKIFHKGAEDDPVLAILNSVSTQMADHMESFTKEINDKIIDTLGLELKNFSEASKNLLRWYEQGMSQYTKSLKDMDKIYQKIQETLTSLSKEIMETLQSMAESNAIMDERNDLLSKQESLTAKWAEHIEEINNSVVKTSGILNDSLSQYQDKFSTALEEASKAVVVNIQQLSEQYQLYFDARQRDTENLANSLNEDRKENMVVLKQEIEDQLMFIKNAIESYMTATLTEFSKQMSALSNNYHENIIHTLGQTTQEHKAGFELLRGNIEKTGEFIKDSQENINMTFDKINALMDSKIKHSENRVINNILGKIFGGRNKSEDQE